MSNSRLGWVGDGDNPVVPSAPGSHSTLMALMLFSVCQQMQLIYAGILLPSTATIYPISESTLALLCVAGSSGSYYSGAGLYGPNDSVIF